MIGDGSRDEAVFAEVHRLMTACLEGDAAAADLQQLERLVCEDPQARRLYVQYLSDSIGLGTIAPSVPEDIGDDAVSIEARETLPDNLPRHAALFAIDPFGDTIHGTAGYFSSGWPVAYLIAMVICGIGLVIGAVTHVSQPAQIVRQHLPSTFGRGAGGEGGRTADTAQSPVVGQITGMVDCRFAEGSGFRVPNSPLPQAGEGQGVRAARVPSPQSPVSLGDKFNLVSGLLEITYGTGARVILQGPVTYEVESPAGGFLSVGKLTARVDSAKPQAADPKFAISNPQSLIPNPLFSVRTPTATVTDLGTEFAVEVDKQGSTTSHVFHGIVEVQTIPYNNQPTSTVRLTENESVRIENPGDGKPSTIRPAIVDPNAFVRVGQWSQLSQQSKYGPLRRWRAYSRKLRNDPTLVAYYPFESVGDSSWLLQNVAATGSALDGEIQGPLWTSGRLPGKMALRFRGPGTGDKVILPQQQRFTLTKPFSIAVWFKITQFRPGFPLGLITKGSAWRILCSGGGTHSVNVDTHRGPAKGLADSLPPKTEVADGRWHLVVAVIEPAETSHRKHLYIDGRFEGEVMEVPIPLPTSKDPVRLGQDTMANREFEGLIDEVAILARALSAAEIAAMFEAGNPAAPSVQRGNNDK